MTDFTADDGGYDSSSITPDDGGYDSSAITPEADDYTAGGDTLHDSFADSTTDDYSSPPVEAETYDDSSTAAPAESWTGDEDPLNSEVSLPGDLADHGLGGPEAPAEPLFGLAGVTENGDPVDYSQSFHGYYDDRTGEEVEPKWN